MGRSVRKLPNPEQMRIEKALSKTDVELKTTDGSGQSYRYKRLWPKELRAIAAVLRNGRAAERSDEAGRLEAMAARLMQPTGDSPTGRPPTLLAMRWGTGDTQYVTRAEAAEKLGVSYGTLSVMLSRGGGTWRAKRRVGRGPWQEVVLTRQKTEEN